MIKNEDTYCIVQHKIVRELGAMEAVVYSTIVSLLRRSDGIGEVSNQTIMDMCGINNKMSLNRYLNKLIETGYIEKREGKGRGNISIYYITKKGNNLLPISEKKGNKNDTEKVTKMYEKGNNLLPINKGINKEINKENSLSSFDGSKAAKEEEDKIFIEKENINNSVISPEDEKKALEDVKNLFAQEEIGNDTKSSFAEFWKLFNPDEDQKCKYKVALSEWNKMEENWREAAITLFSRGARTNERNPYFFLQHFRPTKYFLNEREQYDSWKQGTQLCRVRWNRDSRVMAALFADVFKMEILDDHYEKRFE